MSVEVKRRETNETKEKRVVVRSSPARDAKRSVAYREELLQMYVGKGLMRGGIGEDESASCGKVFFFFF